MPLQTLTDALVEIVTLVRGQLPSLVRKSMGALVVLDVHNRDICQQMASAGTSSTTDFDYTSQLRHYWVGRQPVCCS